MLALWLAVTTAACVEGGLGSGQISFPTARAVEPARGEVSVAGAYLAGRVALDEGDVLTAAEQFEIALLAQPDDADLRRQVFLLRLAGGDLDGARRVAGELMELGIESDEARLLLAFDALLDERIEDASGNNDAVGSGGITGMAKPLIGAWLDFAAGRTDQGLAGMGDENGTDGLALVRSYHRASMLRILDRRDEAHDLLRPMVNADERVPTRLLMALLVVQMETGREAEAAGVLDEQLALAPDDIILTDLKSTIDQGRVPPVPIDGAAAGISDTLSSLGRALSGQRGGGQGLLLARLATRLTPDDGDVWLLIAQLMLAESKAEPALVALDRVDDGSLYAWEASLMRARALDLADRNEEAFTLLRRLGAERPERSDALVTLGDMLRRDERYAEAEVAYSEAMGRIGERNQAHWRLLYARGITYERTERWPQAEADFLEALELEPEQPFVLNYLGYSWVDQGLHLDRAKGMLRRAVELRPEDGFIVDSLGWAHYRLGEYEESVTNLERAVELQPDDPVINDHLGDAYWRVGRIREARFQWERALIFEPEEDVVADIERKLRTGLPENDRERG